MKYVIASLVGLVFTVVSAFIFLSHDQILSDRLYSVAQDRVVRVTNVNDKGHGTGSFVKAKSGTAYILTNHHVCGLADSNGIVKIIPAKGEEFLGKVVSFPEEADLCIIGNQYGGGFNHDAYTMASSVKPGDIIHVFGFPTFHPFAMSDGKIIGGESISIVVGVYPAPDACVGPHRRSEEMCMSDLFGLPEKSGCMYFCIQDYATVSMTAWIAPGNSGSPVINIWGNLVAVIFAGEGRGMSWGYAVPMSDVRNFLDKL